MVGIDHDLEGPGSEEQVRSAGLGHLGGGAAETGGEDFGDHVGCGEKSHGVTGAGDVAVHRAWWARPLGQGPRHGPYAGAYLQHFLDSG